MKNRISTKIAMTILCTVFIASLITSAFWWTHPELISTTGCDSHQLATIKRELVDLKQDIIKKAHQHEIY